MAFVVASLPSRARQQDTLKVDIQLVNVVATVTDENGRYVEGLTVDDFIIEDEGVPQQIVHFTQDRDIPATVGIVIDASGTAGASNPDCAASRRTIHRDTSRG